jgi:Fe-S cluster biogenesis protein NfuA
MISQIPAVSLHQLEDQSWLATHEPSGRQTGGATVAEAEEAMRLLLGFNEQGQMEEPGTSELFEGVARDIALYLEGPVSNMLALHSGFARLEAYQDGIAMVRLGGGCEGCPSSRLTLLNGVKRDLQERFGEALVMDVCPVLD